MTVTNAAVNCVVWRAANAVWTRWSTWGECSATCGSGSRGRQRTCLEPDSGEGDSCSGEDAEKEECSLPACSLPGENVA